MSSHEGVIGKPLVLGSIRYHEKIITENCVGAEGDLTRNLWRLDAYFALEPLAMGIDEADERNRCSADLGGKCS